jgi:4-hydroxy 2-oxovalerate aldolase
MLKQALQGRTVLVVVFGRTSRTYKDEIIRFIKEEHPIVISVNHLYTEYEPDYIFYGNLRRYKNRFNTHEKGKFKYILTSNITNDNTDDIVVDYNKVVSIGHSNYDNSTIMLLNLLRNIGVEKFALAGFDGYDSNFDNNFSDPVYAHNVPDDRRNFVSNEELTALLKRFADSLTKKHSVRFVTPGRFEVIFGGKQ